MNKTINKLSKDNICFLYEYLYDYTMDYSNCYGLFKWDDKSINDFCKVNNIKCKGRRNDKNNYSFFWFDTYKLKGEDVNDIAFHFLRHIRNSIAHANIVKVRKNRNSYFIIDDYDKNAKQTMHGEIMEELFFKFLEIVIKTKQNKQI